MSAADWAQLGQVAKDIGLVALLLIITFAMLFFVVKSVTTGNKQNGDLLSKLVEIFGQSNERMNALQQVIVQGHEQIDVLTKTLAETSAAKVSTLEHNAKATETLQEIIRAQAQALIELRTDYLTRWDEALKKMSGAQDRIVVAVNEHTTTQAALTTGAVIGAQNELTRQHTGQDAGVKALMEESEKRLGQQVEHNGDATRNLIIERLNSINERLDAMQQKAEQRDSLMAKQLHQLSADLSSTLLLITAPKPAVSLTADAGTTPPVDVPKEEASVDPLIPDTSPKPPLKPKLS